MREPTCSQGNSIYFYRFFIYPWTKLFKTFLPKSYKKKQTTLQLDRFCMAIASRKAHGSFAYASSHGSLWIFILMGSIRFAEVRRRNDGFPHSIILSLVHWLAIFSFVFLRDFSNI